MNKYKIDLHSHTIACGHGYSSLLEIFEKAKIKGLEVVGISEHGPAKAKPITKLHFDNLKILPEYIDGIRLLKGAEADIIDEEGNLDLPDSSLKELDYVIASMHPEGSPILNKELNTKAFIKAMDRGNVNILGHIDDGRFELDYKKIIMSAKENKVLIEINNSSLKNSNFRKDSKKNTQTMLDLCKKYKHDVILASDAHISYAIGEFDSCIEALEENDFDMDLVINNNFSKLNSYYLNKGEK